ncbi:L,D-transpeptidase [Dactylosporangium sp. NPDC051541]|uniref:L,D-transpeptidase n=1 Tax=Dactylosporangium sp. NPDC051541 TaxID=3363977 RepID=UPI0037B289AF
MVTALAGCAAASDGEAAVSAAASGVAAPPPGGAAGVRAGEPGPSTARPAPTTGPPTRTPAPSATTEASGPGQHAQIVASSPVVAPTNDAAKLRTLPANTTQVVIVQSASPSATTATLQAYTRAGGLWRPVLGAMTARLGSKGISDDKHEGDKTTPAGVYGIDATMYGINANPGVKYPYHQIVTDDWWNENSDSPGYNTFAHGPNPGGPSEALWTYNPQYLYMAVIRYNMPATPGRGSGIFLHQAGAGSTAGCVSLAQADLLNVLRWLDPAANPQIVMAPTAWLGRY